jgi:hypothetical protein
MIWFLFSQMYTLMVELNDDCQLTINNDQLTISSVQSLIMNRQL